MIQHQDKRPAENQKDRAEKERHDYNNSRRMTGMPETASLPESKHEDGSQQCVRGDDFNAEHSFSSARIVTPVFNTRESEL